MKRSFFQAAVVSILLYGCTTWTLTKRLERRLDGNYTRMLRAVLNKSWRQHPTRLQLYGHLPPITKTIQVRRTRHAGHCWRSKDELISDVLLWTPTHGCARVGRPARTYIQQLCEDTGCNPKDLPEAMNDREKWRETVRRRDMMMMMTFYRGLLSYLILKGLMVTPFWGKSYHYIPLGMFRLLYFIFRTFGYISFFGGFLCISSYFILRDWGGSICHISLGGFLLLYYVWWVAYFPI